MQQLALLVAGLACAPVVLGGASSFPRMEAFVSDYVNSELGIWRSGRLGSSSVRDMACAAWALLNTNYPAPPSAANISDAVGMIDTVFAHQLPSGQWPWYYNSDVCTDTNAVQFISLPILRIVVNYGAALGVGVVSRWLPALELAAAASFAEGIPGAEAQPYYTNIATMRAVNLALFAQVTGNTTVVAEAAAALDAWTTLVTAAGIHEYASPTYTAVTLANLYAGIADISAPDVAPSLRPFVDFVLAQSAVAFWAPATELAGAHSRDYDTVFGSAGMEWAFALSGVGAAAGVPGDDFVCNFDPITQTHLYVSWLRGDLPLAPPSVLALAPTPLGDAWRVAQTSWAASPGPPLPVNGSDSYLFVGAHATLGSASLYYGPQDKQARGRGR